MILYKIWFKIKQEFLKAKKIIAIIRDHHNDNLSNKRCLDLGCSSGEITEALSQVFSYIVGVDIDFEALTTNNHNRMASYCMGSGSELPFENSSFDIIICAQVYEHSESPQKLFKEIYRVLSDNGVCFFSGPNKFSLMEEHYWLPLLSWFPQKISNFYMRLF